MIVSEQADKQQIIISDSGIGYADNNYIVDLPDGTVTANQSETLQNNNVANIGSVNNVPQNNISNTTQVVQTDTTQTLPAETTTAAAADSNGKININTASLDELMGLDGVGEKKAQAIIDYRYENGRFNSVEELTNVNGIGEKTFEKNRDRITVG
ncbi:MAG: helix-hairpin-helix domain-containing protein [Clostridia bacterium]|nr:helix-hairpin-helix domain-containing protein [Clostridia bacterium]